MTGESATRWPTVEVAEVPGPDESPQALARASADITAATAVGDLLSLLARHARASIGARLAVASLTLDDDFSQQVAAVSLDPAYAAWADYDEPTNGSGIYVHVARTGRPMRLTRAQLLAHPHYRGFGHAHDRHPPLNGWLAAPMVARNGRNLGLIQLSDRAVASFTADDEARLVQLAHIAAASLERIQHEEALREERDQAQTLIDAMRDGVVATDRGGRIVRVSPSFCQMTGFPEERLIGLRPPFPFWPPEMVDDMTAATRAVLAEGPQEFELELMRADGTRFPILASVAPHRRSGGLVGIIKDVTQRRQRELNLRRSREDLATAQRIARLGSWTYDIATDTSEWSAEVYRIMGLPPAEGPVSMELFWQRVPPSEHRPIREAVEHAIATGAPYRVEHRFIRPDAGERFVLEQGELERDADGRPKRLMGTVLDVTARRRAEEAEREQSRRIQRLAEDRGRLVADALNAEDRARQRIAEALHDDVLQDLLVARQDIAEAMSADDAREYVDRAHEGITRATASLRQSVGELHPVTLTHGGLRAALRTFAEHAARRGDFELDLRVEPEATGAHDRLLLALVREALTNVERHAGATAVCVAVTRRAGAIELVVRDDGRGIPPGREEEALQGGHIGLASARERVRALDGEFRVESAPGRGTRLFARLPLQD
jgi:PAS domain S-box-containing protein